MKTCEHEACKSTEVIECVLMGGVGEEDETCYYCAKHCQDEGFCWYCGQFWAGVEAFDFSPTGTCPNCRDELSSDLAGDCDDELYYCY